MQTRAFGVVEEARDRILSDDEIKSFWHADDLVHVPLLRFLLLTGLRIGEAQAAQVEWIDADHWLQLPPEVMKAGRPHECYLSKLARTQIQAGASPMLFRETTTTAVQSAVKRWQERHGVPVRWTPHDLRRTYASRLGDLGTAPHIIAKALAHSFTPSASLPTYLRSEWREERVQAAEGLAAHVSKIVAKRR